MASNHAGSATRVGLFTSEKAARAATARAARPLGEPRHELRGPFADVRLRVREQLHIASEAPLGRADAALGRRRKPTRGAAVAEVEAWE